ncbi:MAG: N-acetylmuramoyl-L-alanine amidase [Veillonellaceae bacterium]|nr:N-acetylmuramoyl-L-alanine amidase [Veillonellaceae bacterium]
MIQIENLKELDPFIRRAVGAIRYITLHWTAADYDAVNYNAYHIVISGAGAIYLNRELERAGAHTWRRNTANVGVAIACCGGRPPNIWADGTVADWGDYPPTDEQVEVMAQVVAYLAVGLGVPAENIRDHHYWAEMDGYGSDRIDIMALPQEPGNGRDIILGKARWYAGQWGVTL